MSACGWCGSEVPAKIPGTPGPPKRWCGENCRKRAFDERKDKSAIGRGKCVNPECSNLRGTGAARNSRVGEDKSFGGRQYVRGYCAECVAAIVDVRRTVGEGIWADGWASSEFHALLGYTPPVARSRGWDLPHRRTPEQVERMRASRYAA